MKPTLHSCLNRQMTTRLVLFTLLFLGIGQTRGFAQELFRYTNLTSGVGTVAANIAPASLSRGGAILQATDCMADQGYGSHGWPATNVFDVGMFNLNGQYVEFTLAPTPGYGLKVTGFSARSRREDQPVGTANDGPISMRYGFSTNAGITWKTVNPGNPTRSNVCATQGAVRPWGGWVDTLTSNAIIFRIYGLSSGVNLTGDLFLREIIVNGQVCANSPSITPVPPNFLVCKGQTTFNYIYSAEEGDTYSINFDPAANSAGFIDLASTPLPNAPDTIIWSIPANVTSGSYNAVLTVANNCGFKTNYSVVITVAPLPDVEATLSEDTICSGGTVILTFNDKANTGHTFHIMADLVDDSDTTEIDFPVVPDGASIQLTEGIHFNGNEGGLVTITNVVVTDNTTGCVSEPTGLKLTVLSLPKVKITLSDSAICDDGSVKLTFTDLAATGHTFSITANVVHDGPMLPISYSNLSSGATDTYTEGIDFEGSTGGIVSLVNIVVTDETTGCDTTLADLTITVNPYPVASFTVVPSGAICPGTAIELYFNESAYDPSTPFTVGANVNPLVNGLDTLTFYGVIDDNNGNDHLDLTEGLDFSGDLAITQIWVTEPVSGCSSTALDLSIDVLAAPTFGFTAATDGDGPFSGNNTSEPKTLNLDFCAGDNLTLSGFIDFPGDDLGVDSMGFITSFTTTGNTTYDGNLLPLSSGTSEIAPANVNVFFNSLYGGPAGYGLTPGFTSGTINQIFVPFLDNDNNGQYSAGDCLGDTMFLNYHIHALPTVIVAPANDSVCNGALVNIAFSGNYGVGATYSWTNYNTSVGLSGTGTGNISFTATNTSLVNKVANLTVIPKAEGCVGDSLNFTLTVHPKAVVTNITASVGGINPQSGNNVGGPDTIVLNFCAGQSFTYSGFTNLPNLGFIEEITAGTTNLLYGVTPIPVPRAPTAISPAAAAGFFAGTYGPYGVSSGTYGWMSETFTPYFDGNGDGDYDPLTDCLGNPITIIYHVYAVPTVTVTRVSSDQICSGNEVSYKVTTNATAPVTFDLVFEESRNANNRAFLEDDNIYLPLTTSDTIDIDDASPNDVYPVYTFSQNVVNELGAFDRGRVRLRVINVRYLNANVCSFSANNPNSNQLTQVYPKPILSDPADTTILSGGTATLNFDPLSGLDSMMSAGNAGFPVRIKWVVTTSAGVTVSNTAALSGTTTIYNASGLLVNNLSKKLTLAPNVCSGTVTFHIITESDGPSPGGGFEGNDCTGNEFDVVVNVVKPITFTHVYTGGPVGCGEEITVSVQVSNFCDISYLTYPFRWDTNAFQLVTFTTPNLPVIGGTFDAFPNPGDIGELFLVFDDADGLPPLGHNLPNGTVVLTYILRAVGATGTFNVPDVAPVAEVNNSEFYTIPDSTIGVSIEIKPLSLNAVGPIVPRVCPRDTFIILPITAGNGVPNYFVIDFDAAAEAAGFPDTLEGNLVIGDGQIIISIPVGLKNLHVYPAPDYYGTLTVSNTANDCYSASYPVQINVDDTIPNVPLLQMVFLSCPSQVLAPNTNVVVGETDNCTSNEALIVAYNPLLTDTIGNGCGLDTMFIYRVYSVTDEAGNTANVTQTIKVIDNKPPTVSRTGLAAWYPTAASAITAIKLLAKNSAFDSCTLNNEINISVGTILLQDTSGCTAIIQLIVTDDCSNLTPLDSSRYTVKIDREAPMAVKGFIDDCYDAYTSTDQDSLYQFAILAAIAATTATDDCDNMLKITTQVRGFDCSLFIDVIATDDCEKADTVTYNTRVDNNGPIITSDSTVLAGKCFATLGAAISAAIDSTHAGDNCPGLKVILYEDSSTDCPAEITISVTDVCGNPSYITYTGIHIAPTPPVLDLDLGIATCFRTLEDAVDSLAIAAHPVDNCTAAEDLVVTHSISEIGPLFEDGCRVYDITLTFTNNCDSSVSYVFESITLDSISPTVSDTMPDLVFQCMDEAMADTDYNTVLLEDLVNDNCEGLSVDWVSDTLPTICPGAGKRTFRITDCVGNSTDVIQRIIVSDTIAPIWLVVPGLMDVTCQCGPNTQCLNYAQSQQIGTDILGLDSDGPGPDTDGAEDNCGAWHLLRVPGTFAPNANCALNHVVGTYTNKWYAVDNCGIGNRSLAYIQTITIVDNTAPTWTSLAGALDTVISCSNTVGLAAAQALAPVANDVCSTPTLVKTPGVFLPNQGCAQTGSYTNTWKATDACGNTSVVYTQVISVIDSIAPKWVTPQNQPYIGVGGNGQLLGGINISVSCSDVNGLAFAQTLVPVATDNCDLTVTLTKVSGLFVPGLCAGSGTYTNTWTAKDDCNNMSIVFTQKISVFDNTPPTIAQQCQSLVLNLNTSSGYTCPASATITGLTVGQIITENTTWNIAGQTVASLLGCLSDNCAATSSIQIKVVAIENVYNVLTCVRTITLRFELRDACGNPQPTQLVRTYNIKDDTKPVLTAGSISGCYPTEAAALAAAKAATQYADVCTATVDLTKNAVRTGTLCNAIITVTATDCAGNTSLPVTYRTRIDNAPPVLVASIIPTCYATAALAQASAISGTTITDDCSPIGELKVKAIVAGTCPATITVTATDSCGHSTSITYTGICIGSGSSVMIATPASNDTADCSVEAIELAAWLASHGGATASGSGIVWTYSPMPPVFGLPSCTTHMKSAVVTFKATDGCGYMATTTASFFVKDVTPPTANAIANTNLTCVRDTLGPNISIVTGVSDNCDVTPTVTLFANTKTGTGCPSNPLVIARTYRVTDDYCNTTMVTQMITVIDNVPPTFTAPPNKTVEGCTSAVPTSASVDVDNEADNCTLSGGLQALYTDVVAAGTAFQVRFVITRTWRLTDACGNSAVPRVQTITVKDVTVPTIAGCPGNQVIAGGLIEGICGKTFEAQPLAVPTTNDNCGLAAPPLSYQLNGATIVSGTGGLPNTTVFKEGITTVTYTVTDAVGNTATCSFTVTINCLTISGRIIWEHDDVSGVKDAKVKLSQIDPPAALGEDLSDTNGNYDLTVPVAGTFRVTPVKNIFRLNGVTSADATRIINHVNFSNPILDPYKKVCADVNRSGIITNIDASLITQCLVGNPDAEALFSVFWRFVPTDFPMPVTEHKFVPVFNGFKDVMIGALDVAGVNFFGMKIGDVDTAWANPQLAPNLSPLVWMVQDQVLVAGQDVELTFAASNFEDLAAYQFGLDFDQTQLQFVGFQSLGALPMNVLDNFGAYHASTGELRHVWSVANGTTLADGTPVFRAKFKALMSGQKLSDVLKLDDSQIPCKAYNEALVPTGVRLVYTTSVNTDTPLDLGKAQLQLLQNRPNPFADATTIGFILPEACEAKIRILDISGRELANYDRKYSAGYHELDFRMENAVSYGMLFCELVTPQGKRTIKMVTAK